MRLILLRHGIAEEVAASDFERKLTVQGRTRVRRVVGHFARHFEAPGQLFSSPLVRARQTAAIAGRILDVAVQLCDELRPGGSAFDWVRGLACESLMVVGHEPELSMLAGDYLGLKHSPFSLKKAGMACLEGQPGAAQLTWLITPRWLIE